MMRQMPRMGGAVRTLMGTAACIGALTVIAAEEAAAQQIPVEFFTCTSFDCADTDTNADYFGPAQDSQIEGTSSVAGGFSEANATMFGADSSYRDAYDGFGALYGVPDGANPDDGTDYGVAFNGLIGERQTEVYTNNASLPQNTARWFDSFTNETDDAVTVNLAFGGNLGSDGSAVIEGQGDGYLVLSDGAESDPVFLFVFGDGSADPDVVNSDGDPYTDENQLFFLYEGIEVAPGETVSLVHFNQLFTDEDAYANSIAQALAAGPLFINSEVFGGLTADQVASILNFNIAGLDPTMGDAAALGLPAALLSGQVTKDLLLLNMGAPVGASARMSSGGLMPAGTPMARPSSMPVTGFLIAGAQAGESDGIDYDGRYAGAGVAASAGAASFGIAATTGRAEADNGIDVNGDGETISLFAGYDAGMGPMGRLALTWGDYDLSTSREAGALTAFGDTEADSFSVGAMLGYRMMRNDTALLPYLSAVHTEIDVDAYEETAAAQANLAVDGAELDSTLYEIGLRAGRQYGATSYYGDIAYARAEGDTAAVDTQFTTGTTVSSSTVAGLPDGNALKLGFGASQRFANGLVGGLGYEGYFAGDDDGRHALRASLSMSF